jgi:hypothetical protein
MSEEIERPYDGKDFDLFFVSDLQASTLPDMKRQMIFWNLHLK